MNHHVFSKLSVLVGVVTAMFLSGCGGAGNPPTYEVNGTVVYNGQALTSGLVQLNPEGGGNTAIGDIQPDGTFKLTTFAKDDGACSGTYKVTVQVFADEAPGAEQGLPGMEFGDTGKPPIPLKYNDISATDLTVNVNQGVNTMELILKD